MDEALRQDEALGLAKRYAKPVGLGILGGLALFGAGVQLPTPSWGNIIATDKDQLARSPHIILITSMVIFLTVMALNYLGDVVVERFDVRESVL